MPMKTWIAKKKCKSQNTLLLFEAGTVMGSAGLGTKHQCAGEGQQQFNSQSFSQ
jgi:hypothetical protein